MRKQTENSEKLLKRALEVIPSGTQTFSKSRIQLAQGAQPYYAAKGSGARFWDVDGNEYIDYALALGPIILGYAYPQVDQAVIRQISDGVLFSVPHALEVELSERLTRLIPCAEMVRFGKNGSDVTSGAVRVARAHTCRDLIAVCGYHGWQDWYIGSTYRYKGVPESIRGLTKTFEYNNIESLEALFRGHKNQIAAVVIEALGVTAPQPGFLEKVRELCDRNGAVLIFDEIVTGFRFNLGGVQSQLKVIPDIACFGKAMANGYPLAAVVGKREVMKTFDDVFFSFTFGGDVLSLAACNATLDIMEREPVFETMAQRGDKLFNGIRALLEKRELLDNLNVVGQPQRFVLSFKGADSKGDLSLPLRTLVQQELGLRGVFTISVFNFSYSHTEGMIAQTLKAMDETFEIVAKALREGKVRQMLHGEPVQAVFRKP